VSDDPHEARMALGKWFMKMLEELDEDFVADPQAIDDLRGCISEAFAEWRMKWGYGLSGPGSGPSR
jgi:hypothetical protein